MDEQTKITAVDALLILSMIYDIIDRFRGAGITITPGQLVDYVAEREAERAENNRRLGIE